MTHRIESNIHRSWRHGDAQGTSRTTKSPLLCFSWISGRTQSWAPHETYKKPGARRNNKAEGATTPQQIFQWKIGLVCFGWLSAHFTHTHLCKRLTQCAYSRCFIAVDTILVLNTQTRSLMKNGCVWDACMELNLMTPNRQKKKKEEAIQTWTNGCKKKKNCAFMHTRRFCTLSLICLWLPPRLPPPNLHPACLCHDEPNTRGIRKKVH